MFVTIASSNNRKHFIARKRTGKNGRFNNAAPALAEVERLAARVHAALPASAGTNAAHKLDGGAARL